MKKAIFGYGGHAKEIMCQIPNLICFIDDAYYFNQKNSLPISKFDPTEYELLVAIGDSITRKKIIENLPKETIFFNFVHSTAQIFGDIKMGSGCFIGANSIITTDIVMGNHCLLNRANQIGHDCIIGNFLSMMPGSIISGNCQIGDCVYLGTNSSTKEKIKICNNVIIGLNSGIVKSIDVSGVYAGLPAKYIKSIA
jgi:sugar O-acyltransferase (sialic acid O-acetyltransferase NeuD family)